MAHRKDCSMYCEEVQLLCTFLPFCFNNVYRQQRRTAQILLQNDHHSHYRLWFPADWVTFNGHLNGHVTQWPLDSPGTLGMSLVSSPLYSLAFETGPQPVAGVLPYALTGQGDRKKCVHMCVCVCLCVCVRVACVSVCMHIRICTHTTHTSTHTHNIIFHPLWLSS